MRIRTLLLLIMAAPIAGCATVERAPVAAGAPEWTKLRDPESGYEVWQISAGDSASQAPYFEAQAFTADERYMLFSSKRTGSWQIYRADLETGAVARLTDVEDLGYNSFTMHPNGKDVYFIDGWRLGRADVYTREAATAVDFEGVLAEKPRRSPLSFSKDGRYTVIGSQEGEEALITLVSLPGGEARTVLRWKGAISHPMISPADHNLISFVPGPDTQNDMTLPMEQRARTWIVDARTGEPRRFLTMPYGFRATHEVWSPTGERFYYFRKTQPGWVPVSIMSMDRNGGDVRTHYTHAEYRLGHGDVSEDERWFVSDGQEPGRNPLVLISLVTGKAEILSWPNSSITGGHAEQAHVHPSFSPKGTYIAYTSDRTGTPRAYVVRVPKEVRERLDPSTAAH